MTETFAWPEGAIYIWTGTAGSALVAYAENIQATFARGWENYQTLTGTYGDRFTGQRVDVSIGALHHPDNAALRTLFDAQTAVHLHLRESSILGSAGHFLYSGRIDALSKAGANGGLFTVRLDYHSNVWSAY